MRTCLFLFLLAAPAAARPCDPVCDPACDPQAKAKATATVVSCDPVTAAPRAGTWTVRSTCSGGRAPAVVCVTSPGSCTVSSCSVGGGQGCSASPCTTTAGSCGTVAATSPSAVGLAQASPALVQVRGPQGANSGSVYRLLPGGQSVQVLDDEAREEIRAAVEAAREAQREAVEEAREAQREAAEDVREALRDAREAQREALAEQQEALREAERDVRRQIEEARAANPQAFEGLGDFEAFQRSAWGQAQQALAEVDLEAALAPLAEIGSLSDLDAVDPEDAADDGEAPQGLEERIRALERIAREQGHDTTGGSLEERVAALERALGARRSKLGGMRSPRPGARTIEVAPRAFAAGPDGRLRELRLPRAALAPVPAVPATPRPGAHAAPRAAVVVPGTPSAPDLFAETTPAPPAPAAAPAPAASDWSRPGLGGDERRAIEGAMRDLRAEAEALRAEMLRMRAEIERLPRKNKP